MSNNDRVIVKEATWADFYYFIPVIHPKNIEEVFISSGLSPDECIAFCYELSKERYIALIDGVPRCLFGVIPKEGAVNLWLFFDKDIAAVPISFFRKSKEVARGMLGRYKEITGSIYYKNDFALKWARWAGFTVNDAVNSFHQFYLKRGDS